MTTKGWAGIKWRSGSGHWRTLAATAAVLLLSVQVGLAFHGAAHEHKVDQAGECDYCDLGSHFVAEPTPGQDLGTIPRMAAFQPIEPSRFLDLALQAPHARGPPATSD